MLIARQPPSRWWRGDELRIERPHKTQALTLDDRPPIQEVGREDP
jgi:hypothetical protein